jgi:hypothetical protein
MYLLDEPSMSFFLYAVGQDGPLMHDPVPLAGVGTHIVGNQNLVFAFGSVELRAYDLRAVPPGAGVEAP